MEQKPLYKILEESLRGARLKKIPKNVFGPSPSSVFVGKFGYPNVFVGPMVAVDPTNNLSKLDSPGKWMGLPAENIINMRLELARGETTSSIFDISSRIAGDLRDTALSVRPTDVEVEFDREISQDIKTSSYLQPMGAAGKMNKFNLAENPKIPNKIDQLSEEKLKVRVALGEGFDAGLGDVYYLQRVLSVGALGEKKKMVPTRWSITASDKMLGDHHLETVRDCRQLEEVRIYNHTYLGNHFEILLLPGQWEFEQFESWEPGSNWASHNNSQLEYEYEPFEGRSDYAEREGGGYYAGRLGCIEALAFIRRQARVAVFREISDEYSVPLGVWVVRETVKAAMKNAPIKFESTEAAVAHLKTKLKRPFVEYMSKSTVLKQRKLIDW